MTAEEFLESRIVENPLEGLRKGLTLNANLGFVGKLFSKANLSPDVAAIGVHILDLHSYGYIEEENKRKNAQETLGKTLSTQFWDEERNFKLLKYFFGEEKAEYVRHAWRNLPKTMYQDGYVRRSFRVPNRKSKVSELQIRFLKTITSPLQAYGFSGEFSYYRLNLLESIKYDYVIPSNWYEFMIWAAAIDHGDDKVFELIKSIINNEDGGGKVTRSIIKALLFSKRKECWKLVENLLLAAQRQEGLRQTILESLDETDIGALKYMIKVIIDNNLVRFSSVVRAIDTWTGLGFDAKKVSPIKKVLELANQNFDAPDNIPTEIRSSNNLNVYMALWCLAVQDVELALPYLDELFASGNVEKKRVALLFINEVNIADFELIYFSKVVKEKNSDLLAFTLPWLGNILQTNSRTSDNVILKKYPDLFDDLYALLEKAPNKEIVFEGSPFQWTKATYKKDDIFRCLFYLIGESQQRLNTILSLYENLSVELRKSTTEIIFKEYYAHRYSSKEERKNLPGVTPFQRDFAIRCVKDKSDDIVFSAFYVLRRCNIEDNTLDVLFELLSRKNQKTRKLAEELLLSQKETLLTSFIDRLVTHGGEDQRMAGLDMLLSLKNEKRIQQNAISEYLRKVTQNPQVSEVELKFIENLQPSQDIILTEENGYGFYNPSLVSAVNLPELKSGGIYETLTKKYSTGLSCSESHLKKAISDLIDIYNNNLDYEYEVTHWNNTREVILLGNEYRSSRYVHFNHDLKEEYFETFPLHNLWEKWYLDWGLRPSDLFLLTFNIQCNNKRFEDYLSKYIFFYDNIITETNLKNRSKWDNPVFKILRSLTYKFPFPEKTEFVLELITTIYRNLPEKIRLFQDNNGMFGYNAEGDGWQSQYDFKVLDNYINVLSLSESQVLDYWKLCRWKQYNGLSHNIQKVHPSFYLYCKAYESKLIQEDELYCAILQVENLRTLTVNTSLKSNANFTNFKKEFPFVESRLEKVQSKLLDVEIKRGELSTTTSHFVQVFQSVFGVSRLVQFIKALGATNLYKGYIYSWASGSFSKQQIFSYLIKRTYPNQSDTYEEFERLVKLEKISEDKLIQVAIYAPQWQKYISTYLKWEGLDSAIWWMHAHSKPSGYQEVNAEAESEISKYSSIDIQDFKEGVVDKGWFLTSYNLLGDKRWKLLYNSAKYITDGNGHRRIKLYYETILEKLQYNEVLDKISSKRDQDYLRLYGLLAIDAADPKGDLLRRYNFINQFKKESKQFGSMKQTSESAAVKVAFENLSKNAGYEDPIRLTWAMETQQIREIFEDSISYKVGDISVTLDITADGKAELVVTKGDKPIKSIPAHLKKDENVITLTSHRKTLREQWTRSKKSLEEAMVRGDEFTIDEIRNLFDHPVVSKHLLKLLFVANDGKVGFIDGIGNFVAKNAKNELGKFTSFRIAHCYDIHLSGDWAYFQRFCFENKLKQPFKQIFRELYTPTKEELQEKSVSRRYAGHQVHPRQTSALLKSRGWKLDYESGLQKGFHKEGFIVHLYALADWFTPSDVESPTLETIEFHSLKNFENVAIEDINPRLFSEIMRDVDLVVSVAHVGQVDPEASQSSIEMRKVILVETLRLLKIKNTELKENHAIVEGTLGKYSIHLGSAVVHQIPGKFLNILPVHSQHRGRIFLPFMDEDPKTAEMLSKVILLANDGKIQDPTILSQITRY